MNRTILPSVALLATLGTACSPNTFMAAGRTSDAPPPSPSAVYVASACVNLANGGTVPAHGLRYYVERGNAAIHEFDANGENGTRTANTWHAADGQHFFMWVRRGHGYEIVLPKDGGPVAKRFIYLHGTYKAYREGEVLKVSGSPALMCPLAKAG